MLASEIKTYKDTEQYLKTLPKEKQVVLRKLREVIHKAVPKADELISYSMPAFKQERIICWYAAAKGHYAVYVYPCVKDVFKKELNDFSGTKSAIHFKYEKRMPVGLISKIAKESLRQNLAKAALKKTNKK